MNIRLLLAYAFQAYNVLIIVRALLTWVVAYPTHPAHFFLIQVTEPVLAPVRNMVRRIFPTMRFDFSPVLVILLLNWISDFIIYGIR